LEVSETGNVRYLTWTDGRVSIVTVEKKKGTRCYHKCAYVFT